MPAISYQMYGSRNWALAETLAMLSAAGFSEVEGYGGLYDDPDGLQAALQQNGLRMTTGHFGLAEIEADPQRVIDLAKRFGMEAVFAPFIVAGARPNDLAGWQAFASSLVEAGKPIQDAGLSFGWHNHDFELVDLGAGVTALDVIAQASPDLKLELDIGWVIRAGQDPVAMIQKYGSQIKVAHIKDVAAQGAGLDEDGWSDVGHGVADWAPIHAALQAAGVDRYVLEHDNPNDHQRFATRSLTAVTSF
ncbi:MAG: sugar phosphate isomerase/epimerase [Rhodobacteraceae bacterium]|nr:sugar phosphate isomerase/epimerase [Paracoccaceae bacterium]